jgi:hypothetical protein
VSIFFIEMGSQGRDDPADEAEHAGDELIVHGLSQARSASRALEFAFDEILYERA